MELTAYPGYVAGLPDELGIRDLGGWPTADGRHVRRGLLIRGSALVGLDSASRAVIAGLRIKRVLDLRCEAEAAAAGDLVPDGASYVRICGMYAPDGAELDFSPSGIARLQHVIAREGERFMACRYEEMMFANPALTELVRVLRAGEVPLYFHCTAGKDRTGGVAALALMILGATDETIIEEYLLTNEYRRPIIEMAPEDLPADVPAELREKWAEANGVSEQLLRASLGAIDARFASRADYLASEFGLAADEVQALRDRYLE